MPPPARAELIGHTDAVWDLTLARDESTLISCGAEGSVEVWDVSGPSGGGSLKSSWSYDGLDTSSDLNLEATFLRPPRWRQLILT